MLFEISEDRFEGRKDLDIRYLVDELSQVYSEIGEEFPDHILRNIEQLEKQVPIGNKNFHINHVLNQLVKAEQALFDFSEF